MCPLNLYWMELELKSTCLLNELHIGKRKERASGWLGRLREQKPFQTHLWEKSCKMNTRDCPHPSCLLYMVSHSLHTLLLSTY